MLIFMIVTVISNRWPRFGGGLHGLTGLIAIWFFQVFSNASIFLIILLLIGLGAMYWFGRPHLKKLASSLAIDLPLLTLILFGRLQPFECHNALMMVSIRSG